MRVVGITSSPTRNGNTAVLVREVLRGAASQGAEVEEIYLPEHDLRFCQGCSRCMVEGRCALPDDFESIRATIYAADGLVFGSPTYGGAPNAIMKNLFDRLGLYTAFTSSLSGKYVVGVSTASSMGAESVAKSLTSVVGGVFGTLFARAYVSGTLGIARRGARVKDLPEALDRARRLGSRLADDIERRRTYPVQNLASRLLVALFMRRSFERSIKEHRKGYMKAVYESLVRRGFVEPVEEAQAYSSSTTV